MLSRTVLGQADQGILIKIVNSSFFPLSTVEGNQIRVPVSYQIIDESLGDQKINGIMKVYSENGTLIRSSSFPQGFIAKEGGGVEIFRTTIRDPAVTNLSLNISFIDFARDATLSNTVTANLTLQGNNNNNTQLSDSDAVQSEDTVEEDTFSE
jgi:hypothetical protein